MVSEAAITFVARHCAVCRHIHFLGISAVSQARFFFILLNLALGVLIFVTFSDVTLLTERLAAHFDEFVAWLQALITWLMGNPAGLKLNRPLNTTLGNFFLYHIYLWQTYITFLKPMLLYTLKVIRCIGLLGFSLQAAILSDLISILTVHIYCFHIYAARLYQLQITALLSLWRLFRGKKYNPLRNRVDSIEFDAQQLFLGTVIFTVLLFLLPTVAVYYSVFSGLRLVVIFIQYVLDSVVLTLHDVCLVMCCRNKQRGHRKHHLLTVKKGLGAVDVYNFVKNALTGALL